MQSKNTNGVIFSFPQKNLPPVLNALNHSYFPMNNLNFSGGFQNGGGVFNHVAGPYIQNPNSFFFNSMYSPNSLQYGGPLSLPVYPSYIPLPNPNGLHSHGSLNKLNLSNLKSHQNNVIRGKKLKKEGEGELALTSLIRELLKCLETGKWISNFYYVILPNKIGDALEQFIARNPKENLPIKIGCKGMNEVGVEIGDPEFFKTRLIDLGLLKEQDLLIWKKEDEAQLLGLISSYLKTGHWIKEKPPRYFFILPNKIGHALEKFLEGKPEEKENLHIIKMDTNDKKQMGVVIDDPELFKNRLQFVMFESIDKNSLLSLIEKLHGGMQDLALTQRIWINNPILENWYSGKKRFSEEGQGISFCELNTTFQAALRAKNIYIIQKLWSINPLLKSWYSGEKVDEQQITRTELDNVCSKTSDNYSLFIRDELFKSKCPSQKKPSFLLEPGFNKRKHNDLEEEKCLPNKRRKNNENTKKDKKIETNDKKINLNPAIPNPSFEFSIPNNLSNTFFSQPLGDVSTSDPFIPANEEATQNMKSNDLFEEFIGKEELFSENLLGFLSGT